MSDPEQVSADSDEARAAAGDDADLASSDTTASPLRGSLDTNVDPNNLHDMGGDIGTADDTARGDDPQERP